jgi:hypothetical protein
MLQEILNRLFPRFDIQVAGDLYLRRWRLIRHKDLRVNLHHIRRSDSDQHLHDHPWDYTSLILWGGYIEETFQTPAHPGNELPQTKFERYGIGSLLRRTAEHTHKLHLNKPAWTLVFLGPRRRKWGFRTQFGHWVYWRDYLGVPPGDDGRSEGEENLE